MAFFQKNTQSSQTGQAGSSNSSDTSSNSTSSMPGRSTSSAGTIITFILVIAIFFGVSQMYKENDISWSTIQRDAVEGAPAPTEYYTDESGNYLTETTIIEDAVYTFYSKTGVPMYIYFLEDDSSVESASDLYDITQELYEELFDDEYHFLMVACYNGEEFLFNYTAGDEAASVMDDTEGITIFDDCVNLYFEDDDISESIATAIKRAAVHIMQAGNLGYRIVIIGAIVVAAIVYLYFRYKKNGGNWKAAEKSADGRTIIRFKKY